MTVPATTVPTRMTALKARAVRRCRMTQPRLRSYQRSDRPGGGNCRYSDALKEIDDAKLESQLKALVKIFDVNGGLDVPLTVDVGIGENWKDAKH